MLSLIPPSAAHPLHPSVLRAWRLPDVPEQGMIVRVMECEYTAIPQINGVWVASKKFDGNDLQSCLAQELSSWYRSVPASSVYPDNSDLFFSYTNVLGNNSTRAMDNADNEQSPDDDHSDEDEDDVHDGLVDIHMKNKGWLPSYPSKRLLGLILSNEVAVDEAYPHDAWSTSPSSIHPSAIIRNKQLRYLPCDGIRLDYAQKRLENTLKRCALLQKHPHGALKREAAHDAALLRNGTTNSTPYLRWKRYRRFKIAEQVQFPHWVETSGYTCYHKYREDAEAEQQAYLDLLVANGTTCESGPLYNQLQVRYTVRMITGVFFTPELRKEALQVRDAIHAMRRTFGGDNEPLKLVEAERTENYPSTLKDYTGDDTPTGDALQARRHIAQKKPQHSGEPAEPQAQAGDANLADSADETSDTGSSDAVSWKGALQPETGPW